MFGDLGYDGVKGIAFSHSPDSTTAMQEALALDLPASPESLPRYAVLERNAEFVPMFNLGQRPVSRVEYHGPNGQRITVSTGSKRGLPKAMGQDVYLALCHLLNPFAKSRTTPSEGVVVTTFAELLDLTKRGSGGEQYRMLKETLLDLSAIHIEGENVFGGGVYGRRTTATINILKVSLSESVTRPKASDTTVRITFDPEFLSSVITHRYLRTMDLDRYLSFEEGIQRRLYRLLDLSRWEGRVAMPTFEIPLLELAMLVPLANQSPSQILRVLDRHHRVLADKGLLAAPPTLSAGYHAADRVMTYRYADVPILAPAATSDTSKEIPAQVHIVSTDTGSSDRHRESADRLAAETALRGLGLTLPPAGVEAGEPDLAAKIRRVTEYTGDYDNYRTFKDPCERLTMQQIEDILSGMKKDDTPPRLLGAAFNSRANTLLGRKSAPRRKNS